ncbi:outer membrane autotransporter protein [Podospora australis]|uniref:Outer membrane autotransporter protein n=1 Tax=Podospora australis TaxID=1536484 RepID=A0AAN7ACM1_9PEZI|nr:outer membrane autotransporter protein [Podospora australis]
MAMARRTLPTLAVLAAAMLSPASAAPPTTPKPAPQAPAAFSTTCNSKPYTYNELAGYGFLPHDARDKYGDTISFGSSIAFSSWRKVSPKRYVGEFYGLPDRGWNTEGTVNFQPRIHKLSVTLAVSNGPNPNVHFKYLDTILLTGPDGKPATGLDPDQTSGFSYKGFPLLPAATYAGDGFGGSGPGGKRVSLDTEALVLGKDGTFWISDEYGPYVYQFDRRGRMIIAVAPPDAILPLRNGSVSFSSDNPPRYDPAKHPVPVNPTQGRQNNQGFEGMAASPDGKTLWVLLQSAARQEGGKDSATRRYARLLEYSVKGSRGPQYSAEYVVPLPTFKNAEGKTRVAAQSELHYVSGTQFLLLSRDSNNGRGLDSSQSLYRHVDVVDIKDATNVKGGKYDVFNASIASSDGVLHPEIKPATVCAFLDINNNAQLNRFGVHNGGPQDTGLLNEKWEGLALVPVDDDDGHHAHGHGDKSKGEEYFLFVASDNDFISQNGYMKCGQIPFKDSSGVSLDNQVLVFRVTVPKASERLAM